MVGALCAAVVGGASEARRRRKDPAGRRLTTSRHGTRLRLRCLTAIAHVGAHEGAREQQPRPSRVSLAKGVLVLPHRNGPLRRRSWRATGVNFNAPHLRCRRGQPSTTWGGGGGVHTRKARRAAEMRRGRHVVHPSAQRAPPLVMSLSCISVFFFPHVSHCERRERNDEVDTK